MVFDEEEEAIALANDTSYGLTAGLWTQDVGRALRVSQRIEAGMVWVNTYRYIRWSPVRWIQAKRLGPRKWLGGTRSVSGNAYDNRERGGSVS
jgi:acyl-CoA reductase-like NAD-dependent aldehyde dehydrogenase